MRARSTRGTSSERQRGGNEGHGRAWGQHKAAWRAWHQGRWWRPARAAAHTHATPTCTAAAFRGPPPPQPRLLCSLLPLPLPLHPAATSSTKVSPWASLAGLRRVVAAWCLAGRGSTGLGAAWCCGALRGAGSWGRLWGRCRAARSRGRGSLLPCMGARAQGDPASPSPAEGVNNGGNRYLTVLM